MRLALGAEKAGGLEVNSIEADGPLGELLAGLAAGESIAPLEPPPGLTATLRPYQVRGYAWLEFLTRWGLGPWRCYNGSAKPVKPVRRC